MGPFHLLLLQLSLYVHLVLLEGQHAGPAIQMAALLGIIRVSTVLLLLPDNALLAIHAQQAVSSLHNVPYIPLKLLALLAQWGLL